MQWTDNNGQLTGQIQVLSIDKSSQFMITSTNLAFTGLRSGSSVSLTIAQGLGIPTTWTGTVEGDTLSLVIPDANGFLRTTEFRAGAVGDYNTAAAAFRGALQQRAQQAQVAAAAANQQTISTACRGQAVGVVGHDAAVIFGGRDAVTACTQFLNSNPPDGPYEARAAASSLPLACGIAAQSVTVTVVDSGFQSIASSDICPYIQRSYQVSGTALDNAKSLTAALSQLGSDTQSLRKDNVAPDVDKVYSQGWQKMQDDYQKEIADSKKVPITCYQKGTVQYDAGTVDYDLSTIKYNDGTLSYILNGITTDITSATKDVQAAQQALAAYRASTATGNGATPQLSFTLDDAATNIATVQSLANIATNIVQKAQSQAAVYDQKAAALDQQARALVASLTCSG